MNEHAQQPVAATDGDSLTDQSKTLVLEEIWNIFATTLDKAVTGDAVIAGFQLREMLATLDMRFRCLRTPSSGGIHDALTMQIHEVLSDRFADFIELPQARSEAAAAQWLVGAIQVYHELAQLAHAFETVTADNADTEEVRSDRKCSFAGKSTFIPISQVVQLLGGSRHRGVLTLEVANDRLEIYFDDSCIAFFSPHRFLRRVIVGTDMHQFRELPRDALTRAERHFVETGKPIVIDLAEQGVLTGDEVRDMSFTFGSEVFFKLLHDDREVGFKYTRLKKLPDFAIEHSICAPITPLLLESNKQQDDWLSLLKVFPNPDRAIEPTEDSLRKVADMQLAAHELRILMAIDGKVTPRGLTDISGLPLLDVYRILVQYTRDEVILPHCEPDEFAELLLLGLTDEEGPTDLGFADPDPGPGQGKSFRNALDFLDG